MGRDSDTAASSTAEEEKHTKKHVKVTPLPKLKMVAVAATLLTESICSSMLFPFVGLFVARLQGISVEDAGYYSGILVGLFMLGQVVSSKPWGWLSDQYGRKGPLTTGLLAAAWTMLFFGMSPNIYVCCVLRFIHGVLNGNTLIAKIVISDITDETNAALGFSMVGLLWCVGGLIGPAVGGFLYDPLDNPKLQWMHVKEGSFLARNPAFLPSFVLFVYTMASFALCMIILPETNAHRTKSLRDVPVLGHIINIIRPKAAVIIEATDAPVQDAVAPTSKPPAMTYSRALRDPVILGVTILYMCLGATDMSFGEILPLWAIAPFSVGGLEMFSDTVGVLMLCFSVPTLATNLSFSKVYRKINNSALMWRLLISVFIIVLALMPLAPYLSKGLIFWYVLLLGSAKSCASSAAFNMVHLLTAKAAPPGTVGSVYGISQSMAGIVRCAVPFVVAPLFAWSLADGRQFPFNHYFVFLLSILPIAFSFVYASRRRIERSEEDLIEVKESESMKEESDDDVDDDVEGISMEEYRSLANSFAAGPGANLMSIMPEIKEESERQIMIRDWVRRAAPRGRGEAMQSVVKLLKHEDYRLASDEDIEEL